MRAALLAFAALALGACASTRDAQPDSHAITPSERFAIEVKPEPLELRLAPHADGLSSAQSDALRDFAGRWVNSDRGVVTVKSPEHGPEPAAAYRTATAAREALIAGGVAPSRVQIAGYEADGDGHAPVVVSVIRNVAVGPHCSGDWSDLANVRANTEYPEFGCAVTANFAAQVANPTDLVGPRASTPPDAGRRQAEIDKYRQGQLTSSPKDPQADGTLAKVGQ